MTTSSNPNEEYITGASGLRIFVRSWLPDGAPKAVVAICHGVNSHSGQYFWAAGQLVAEGYAVFALDLRGRGNSDGERFFVETVDDYVSDLSHLIDLAVARHPGLAVFLLGHDVQPTLVTLISSPEAGKPRVRSDTRRASYCWGVTPELPPNPRKPTRPKLIRLRLIRPTQA